MTFFSSSISLNVLSYNLFSLLWFQGSVTGFLHDPAGTITRLVRTLPWPTILIVAAIFFAAWFGLKKALQSMAASRKKASGNQFPGEEAAFRAVFEESTFGVALLDREGRILHTNHALQKLFGFDYAQLLHQPISNLAHPEDAHVDKTQYTELVEGHRKRYTLERRFYDSQGKVLWLREEVIAPDNQVGLQSATPGTRTVVLLEDVTRRRLSEEELQITREAIHNLYQVIVDRHLGLIEKMEALLKMGCRRFGVETGVLGEAVAGGFEILQVVSPDERIRRGKVYERSVELGDWPEPVFARNTRLSDGNNQHAVRDWRRFPFYGIADVEVFLSAPVFVYGQFFGALCFSGVSQREEAFAKSDKEYLQLMAQWLGAELERLQALADLEAKQHELMEANAKLEALATVDGLTGVKNRRALEERLEMELRRARRYKTPLSFLLLDVDKFKQFNDSFGHLSGDEVLKQVAQILEHNVRVIDFVARYGGEEFAVLLPQTDVDGAMIVADRLRFKIEQGSWPQRQVTASFGIATLSDKIQERSELISEADRALYFSKEAGRNRCTHVNDVSEPVEPLA